MRRVEDNSTRFPFLTATKEISLSPQVGLLFSDDMVAGNAGLVVVAVAVHGWMDGTASSINQINAIIQL